MLAQFTLGWNKYSLRTTQNLSPGQIWVNGMINQRNGSQLQIADLHTDTIQKLKFSIEDVFSKCDQIRRKLRIWSHLLTKSLMINFVQ